MGLRLYSSRRWKGLFLIGGCRFDKAWAIRYDKTLSRVVVDTGPPENPAGEEAGKNAARGACGGLKMDP
jgi:hypothetical protein